MTLSDLRKTPFPWFGGKSDAAPAVWEALGDVSHYVEPFAGSLAVLMRRPHPANRTHYSETVNDLDGLLCNFWRAISHAPEAVAEAASWPVCEADLHARHLALLAWRAAGAEERLMGNPDYYDARMAGWWAWGQSCWIGSGWCSGRGPWIVGPDGRITKRGKGADGVSRQVPSVGDGGRGANHPLLPEEGVHRKIPFVGHDGRGVAHGNARAEGVARQIPHLSDTGQGANHPMLPEHGVGVEPEYHPMTMPELLRWFRFLAARLRHVRVLHGDWTRVVTNGVLKTLAVRGGGVAGVFLDPPYTSEVCTDGLYARDSGDVAHAVRAWCRDNGADPDLRIVLAGYDTEHVELESHGWTVVEWFKAGFLKGGMANQSADGTQQARERLWLSPHCTTPAMAQRQRVAAEAMARLARFNPNAGRLIVPRR